MSRKKKLIIHEIELILELLGPLLGFKETDREHVGEREREREQRN